MGQKREKELSKLYSYFLPALNKWFQQSCAIISCGEIIQYNVHSRISTDCFIRSHSPSKYTQHIPIYNRFMNKVRLAHTLTGLLSVVNYPQIHLAIRHHVSTWQRISGFFILFPQIIICLFEKNIQTFSFNTMDIMLIGKRTLAR